MGKDERISYRSTARLLSRFKTCICRSRSASKLDTVIFNGREISKAYAEYLLQFEDTFLKPLADDNIRNTDDKSERFLPVNYRSYTRCSRLYSR